MVGGGAGACVAAGDGGGAAGAAEAGPAAGLLPAVADGWLAGRCLRFLCAVVLLGLGLGVACAVGRIGGLVVAPVCAPAERANKVAKATAVIALSCVARQVRRDSRRRPSSRGEPGVWGAVMGLIPPGKTLRANQEPLKGPLLQARETSSLRRVNRRFPLRAVKQ